MKPRLFFIQGNQKGCFLSLSSGSLKWLCHWVARVLWQVWGGVEGNQPLWGGGGGQGGLQVDRLVEQFVAYQHNQGEET